MNKVDPLAQLERQLPTAYEAIRLLTERLAVSHANSSRAMVASDLHYVGIPLGRIGELLGTEDDPDLPMSRQGAHQLAARARGGG